MGLLIGYEGKARTEADVDRVLAAVRAYAKSKSLGVIEITPETAQRLRKMREILDLEQGHISTEAAEKALGRITDLELQGARRDAGVKGAFVKVHPSADYMNVAFVERWYGWLLDGQVKEDFTPEEAHEEILEILDLMKSQGVELKVSETEYFEAWELEGNEYHADATAKGENPYYPGTPAAPPGGYRHPNPTGVWKTEARAWLRAHPESHSYGLLEDVKALYAFGAVNIGIR